MPFIGNQPAESYASFERQVFTIVNSQTAYTLTHAVTNENDIRLVINSVVQEPGSGKAYTASNTTLTLSAALVNGTDEMYCVYLGRALQTVNPPNASVGNSQTAPTIITGQTAETSIATDDTILIHDTSASALRKMTRANFVSGIGGANTPSFLVKLTSDQTISDSVYTKIQFNSEDYDSDNVFDNSSNYKFTVPSGKAGKYFLYTNVRVSASAASRNDETRVSFYKNGTIHVNNQWTFSSNPIHITNNFFSATIDLAVGDYIEVYTMIGEASAGNGTIKSASYLQTYFGGYKIIE